MTERDVLRRAKEVLLERGWCQGAYGSDLTGETGSVCLIGAVNVARGGTAYDIDTGDPVLVRLCMAGYGQSWNDMPGRRFAQVIDAFDKTIAALPADEVSPQEDKEPVHA